MPSTDVLLSARLWVMPHVGVQDQTQPQAGAPICRDTCRLLATGQDGGADRCQAHGVGMKMGHPGGIVHMASVSSGSWRCAHVAVLTQELGQPCRSRSRWG